jgi:hypothetical protein
VGVDEDRLLGGETAKVFQVAGLQGLQPLAFVGDDLLFERAVGGFTFEALGAALISVDDKYAIAGSDLSRGCRKRSDADAPPPHL